MNTHSDPLLRAVADGDPACPDGQRLAALGRLIRFHATPPREADLGEDVIARLHQVEDSDTAAIDAFYDTPAHPDMPVRYDLSRLAEVMRSVQPRSVDLRAQVLKRIRQPAHLDHKVDVADDIDGNSRWRIWSMVVAGHVAALLAFAVFGIGLRSGDTARDTHHTTVARDDRASDGGSNAPGNGMPGDGARSSEANSGTSTGSVNNSTVSNSNETPGVVTSGKTPSPALPPHLPASWADIRGLGTDLFLLRRFPELRQDARRTYAMADSAAAMAAGLAWIICQQDQATGAFGISSGHPDRDLATHGLATLVLLGEGLGDKARTSAARRGLAWLRAQLALAAAANGDDDLALNNVSPTTAGIVCLALVEGSLLLGDELARTQAEHALSALDHGLPLVPGASGLGGFSLLALETAQQGGLRVPGKLLQQARYSLGRSLPGADDDIGRLGLAAFARCMYGYRASASTLHQIKRLAEHVPAADASGRIDPLGWFLPTLAMREAGGNNWAVWAQALQQQLLPLLPISNGLAHVDANKVRYANNTGDKGDKGNSGDSGDLFATSLVLMNLQAPYRYLPVADK